MLPLRSLVQTSIASPDLPSDPLADVHWGPERVWTGRDGDDGAVHCLGNGAMCVYQQGPDVVQVFGPPYSTRSIGRIDLAEADLASRSTRVRGTAIWRHHLTRCDATVATMTDFVDSTGACFVRRIATDEPLHFTYIPDDLVRIALGRPQTCPGDATGGMIAEMPIGAPIFGSGSYPIPFPTFHQFAWTGDVTARRDEATGAVALTFGPGTSDLYIGGGRSLPDGVKAAEAGMTAGCETMLRRTRAWWESFSAQGPAWHTRLPQEVPMRERLLEVLDDLVVLIRTQQGSDGGVLAGYPYHMAYVRDQFGAYRGLCAMGREGMARAILDFYFQVFSESGTIRNAQGIGVPRLFHLHENDDVEITGYILLQAFDYLRRTDNSAYVRHIFPMLEWAWDAQKRHLARGMLPFNGDETYVAGGLLPRTALNDGSAEATMLFVDSGAQLLDFAATHKLWSVTRQDEEGTLLDQVRTAYRDNFWRNGRLVTNTPERRDAVAALPRFRHGVCEACMTVTWTMKTANDRYVCVSCREGQSLPRVKPQTFLLQSVSLTPLYFQSTLFEPAELESVVAELVDEYERTGALPSRPDSDVAVGYDYGLLLYALTETKHPAARTFFELTLSLADATGAWAEYYRDHMPFNTRCRPWESAINMEALLHWVATEYGFTPEESS